MSTKRPSGFRVRAPAGFAALLVGASAAASTAALSQAGNALAEAGFVVTLDEELGAVASTPDLVVAVDGWGRLTLEEAGAAISQRFAAAPAIAIVSDARPLAPLFAAGFVDCLRAPFDAAELIARAHARIESLSSRELASIAIDADQLTIRCNRVQMRLTPGEFGLLRQLLDSPGQWVSSKALLQGSPGKPRAGKMRVAARAYSIRKKLQHEAWRLRGHRTLGYLFETSARATDDDVASKNG